MAAAYKGYLDNVTSTEVTGWAICEGEEQPQEVKLYLDGELFRQTHADIFRIGIFNKQIHPSGKCGFHFNLVEEAIPEGSQVRCTVGPDDVDLINSPWKFGIKEGEQVSEGGLDSPKLFFMHIAKTAGSSLNAFLASHYAKKRVWTHLEGNKNWDPDFIANNYDFLSGHLRIRKVANLLNLAPFKKVTLLRNPLEQLVSHLCWVRHISEKEDSRFFKNHPEHIKELSLQLKHTDFSEPAQLADFFNGMNAEAMNLFDNCQTRYFLEEQLHEPVGLEHFNIARDTLDFFDLVGTLEFYDEFLQNLCKQMGWTYEAPAKRLNVQSERYGLNLGDPETLQVLWPQVAYDGVLYREAQRREY